MLCITRFKNYIKHGFFNDDYPLKYHIFSIVFFEMLLLSVVSAATNTALGKGIGGIIFQWTFVLVCVFLLFSPVERRMKLSTPMILIAGFIYLPFMYFPTAGYDGTALLFTLLFAFIISFFFEGKTRFILIVLNLAEYFCCIALQYNFPNLVSPHGSISAKIIDTVVALTLTFAGMAIMTTYVNSAYRKEQEKAQKLIDQVSSANEQLAILSTVDPLTGANNRRFIDSYLLNEISNYNPQQKGLFILIFDIDFFKRVNDIHGHGFGDYVLKTVAATIAKNLRDSDVFARFGGEEFISVLRDESLDGIINVAERLRTSVSEIEFRNDVRVTISIGVAQMADGDTVETLFDRADQNLYRAKENGRNMVCY